MLELVESMVMKSESGFLKAIHIKIAIAISIITPTLTASGAYWGVKMQIVEKDLQVSDRISKLELSNQKTFADKEALDGLTQEVRSIHDDIIQIKAMLLQKHR